MKSAETWADEYWTEDKWSLRHVKHFVAAVQRDALRHAVTILHDFPDDWDKRPVQWKAGYNQARNKVATIQNQLMNEPVNDNLIRVYIPSHLGYVFDCFVLLGIGAIQANGRESLSDQEIELINWLDGEHYKDQP